MTTSYIAMNTIMAGPVFTYGAGGDELVVLQGVTVASTDAAAINFNEQAGVSLYLAGSMFSERGLGTSQSAYITVSETGRFVSTDGVFEGLGLLATGSLLRNAGSVESMLQAAVVIRGDSYIYNTGLISGYNGVEILQQGGSRALVENAGRIFGASGLAVYAQGAVTLTNLAGGEITSINESAAIYLYDQVSGGSTIRNFGLVSSNLGWGIAVASDAGTATVRVINHGTVSGGFGSFLGGLIADIAVNRGVMAGDVIMGLGNDLFDNRDGRIEGTWYGGLGNDRFDGRGAGFVAAEVLGEAGDDTLLGGDGADQLDGGADADELRGGGGDDVLAGGSGEALLYGGDGDDLLWVADDGTAFMVAAMGGTGNDTFLGGGVQDVVFGGRGDDAVYAGDGLNTLRGDAGDDVLSGGADADRLFGGADADSLSGSGGADELRGGLGDDTLPGGGGADTIAGGSGDDEIDGGTEADSIDGGGGRDTVQGGQGADRIDGGADDDLLAGGGSNDSVWGGNGDDTVNGEAGGDVLAGGAGRDMFLFTLATHSGLGAGADTIADMVAGDDRIDISALAAAPLVFRGTGAFSGGGTASVRYDVAGGTATVRIDANGDGTADAEIAVTGIATLSAADFVL